MVQKAKLRRPFDHVPLALCSHYVLEAPEKIAPPSRLDVDKLMAARNDPRKRYDFCYEALAALDDLQETLRWKVVSRPNALWDSICKCVRPSAEKTFRAEKVVDENYEGLKNDVKNSSTKRRVEEKYCGHRQR